jgi:uncharacterized protein (TIGR01244 family)
MRFPLPLLALVAALNLTIALPVAAAESAAKPAAERPAEWAQPTPGVGNLHRITPSLYRSEQFTQADVAELQKLGIKKVISFRAFHSDEEMLAGSGIVLQRIPIHTWDIDDEEIIAALKALRDVEQDGPILIHCQHGADRTGLIAALYRVLYQGWSKEQALDELQNGGYGFHSIWFNVTRYLQRVDVERLRAKVEK